MVGAGVADLAGGVADVGRRRMVGAGVEFICGAAPAGGGRVGIAVGVGQSLIDLQPPVVTHHTSGEEQDRAGIVGVRVLSHSKKVGTHTLLPGHR